jgi:hypothetical protein
LSAVNPLQQQPPSRRGGGAPWEGMSPKGLPYISSNFFVYESDIPAALNAGSSTTLTFNVAGDSDFFWTKFAAFALVGGAATTRSNDQLPAVTALIVNTTTSRQYSSGPVPLANMAGTGVFPFILPMVVLWQAFSTISITLANEGNAAYSNLQLSFIGVKAFTGQSTSPQGS